MFDDVSARDMESPQLLADLGSTQGNRDLAIRAVNFKLLFSPPAISALPVDQFAS